jgi:hypothetical protein
MFGQPNGFVVGNSFASVSTATTNKMMDAWTQHTTHDWKRGRQHYFNFAPNPKTGRELVMSTVSTAASSCSWESCRVHYTVPMGHGGCVLDARPYSWIRPFPPSNRSNDDSGRRVPWPSPIAPNSSSSRGLFVQVIVPQCVIKKSRHRSPNGDWRWPFTVATHEFREKEGAIDYRKLLLVQSSQDI